MTSFPRSPLTFGTLISRKTSGKKKTGKHAIILNVKVLLKLRMTSSLHMGGSHDVIDCEKTDLS